jgi:GNAT superfamily N-acetyltransferase
VAHIVLDKPLTIARPEIHDWGTFFFLAQAEHWLVLPPEVALFRGPLASWAFALRHDGETCGFVTAVPYRDFAWIGNLIVARDLRGQGFGGRLFDHVCEHLQRAGIKAIWLTASDQGRPLYASRGFREFDRVSRWTLKLPERRHNGHALDSDSLESLVRADRRVWGTDRRMVLHALSTGGDILRTDGGIALLQSHGPLKVLGPWLAEPDTTPDFTATLRAVVTLANGGTLYTDILTSSGVEPLLRACGFTPAGSCSLMVRGEPAVDPHGGAVALASLGSLG